MKRRIILLLLISTVLLNTVPAQKLFDYSGDFNLFRKYYPLGINASANIYPFYENTPLSTGKLTPKYYLMWGFSAGITYHLRITNHFGLKFALKAERQPVYSYRLFIPSDQTQDGDEFYYNTGNRYAPFMIRFPAGIEYRTFSVERYTFFLQPGIDLGYHFGYNELRQHNQYFSTAFANDASFVFDPYIKAGWYYEFPWGLWQTGFIYRHTLSGYFSGVYNLHNLNSAPAETGIISQPGKYIGLEFVFYFKRPYYDNARCAGQVHSKKVLKRRRAEQKARERARKAEEKAKKKEIKRNKRMKRKRKRFILF
jgi:hypothetical protein